VYKAGTKSRPENTEAISLLENFKLQPRGEQSVENQQLRMVSRFVNEAVLCLEESILNSPVCMTSIYIYIDIYYDTVIFHIFF